MFIMAFVGMVRGLWGSKQTWREGKKSTGEDQKKSSGDGTLKLQISVPCRGQACPDI